MNSGIFNEAILGQ